MASIGAQLTQSYGVSWQAFSPAVAGAFATQKPDRAGIAQLQSLFETFRPLSCGWAGAFQVTQAAHFAAIPDFSQAGRLDVDAGRGIVKTPGGFVLSVKDGQVTITAPNGKNIALKAEPPGRDIVSSAATRDRPAITERTLRGDPVVRASDGREWRYTGTGSFVLPDGTRIRISEAGKQEDGTLHIDRVDVYNGNKHFAMCSEPTSHQKQATRSSEVVFDRFGAGALDGDDWAQQAASALSGMAGSGKPDEAFHLGTGIAASTLGQMGLIVPWKLQMMGFTGVSFASLLHQQHARQPARLDALASSFGADQTRPDLGIASTTVLGLATTYGGPVGGAALFGAGWSGSYSAQVCSCTTAVAGLFSYGRKAALSAGQLGSARLHGSSTTAPAPTVTTRPGRPPGFPRAEGSAFLGSLPDKACRIAPVLNVSGKKDIARIAAAVTSLKQAAAGVEVSESASPASPSPGKLPLTAEETERMRSAPSLEAAKDIVRDAVARQTGHGFKPIDMGNKIAIRDAGPREALNVLLGVSIRGGTEKNSGSSLVMDAILESVARSVRDGDFGSTIRETATAGAVAVAQTTMTAVATASGSAAAASASTVTAVCGGATSVAELDNPARNLSVDLSAYVEAARRVSELSSPLIFDLAGTGLDLAGVGFIDVDLDGDGKLERIRDLDAETGLLVFDSRWEPADGEDYGPSGMDMFGNNTDLSAYGIAGSEEDGTFADGFAALAALARKLAPAAAGHGYLAPDDLAFLEERAGLRMRVGGIAAGENRRFAALGITRIALGDPERTELLERAREDRWGNRLMRQEGATFLVQGAEREYVDIWFNVVARTPDSARKRLASKLALKRTVRAG